MKINLGHVLTNAIATLVAAVFVGAMAIVWTGETSVGDEVERAGIVSALLTKMHEHEGFPLVEVDV